MFTIDRNYKRDICCFNQREDLYKYRVLFNGDHIDTYISYCENTDRFLSDLEIELNYLINDTYDTYLDDIGRYSGEELIDYMLDCNRDLKRAFKTVIN